MAKSVDSRQPSADTRQMLKAIGSELSRARAERGESLADVAKVAKVSRQMVWEVEKGSANPTATCLDRIARAVGLRITLAA